MRSTPSVASSLESENSEGECELFPLCFLFLSFFPYPIFFSFLHDEAPCISSFLEPFCHRFFTLSSICFMFFPESLRKSGDQKEEALPQETSIGSLFFFFSFFFCHSSPSSFFKTKSVLPFSFLLRMLIQALKILSLLFLREL